MEKSKHPLEYFIDFFYNDGLSRMEKSFLSESIDVDGIPTYKVDRKKKSRVLLLFDNHYTEYFKDFLDKKLSEEFIKSLQEIKSKLLFEFVKSESNKFYNEIIHQLNVFINERYEIIDPKKNYPFIKDKMLQLRSILTEKRDQQQIELFKKLKWNGNTNTLIWIFRQLIELKINDKFFIESDESNIIRFIINSFIDKNGQNINEDSIKRYLTPNSNKFPKSKDNFIELSLARK